MVFGLVLLFSILSGFYFRSLWLLLAPLALGSAAAAVILVNGHGLGDTPIIFLVILATLAMGGGRIMRGRWPCSAGEVETPD